MTNPEMIAISLDPSDVKNMEEYLVSRKGYDSAEMSAVRYSFTIEDWVYSFDLDDKFQRTVDYDKRLKQGSINFYLSDGPLWRQLQALPGRATRELHVLTAQLAFTNDMSEYRSAQASAFAEDLMEKYRSLHTMLTDKTAVVTEEPS